MDRPKPDESLSGAGNAGQEYQSFFPTLRRFVNNLFEFVNRGIGCGSRATNRPEIAFLE